MALTYTELTQENLNVIESIVLPFLDREWPRDFTDDFLSWQFLQKHGAKNVLALDGDRCVAMIHSCLRPYAINGEKVTVRETGFWVTEPDYRPFTSIRVLQTMMSEPEPIMASTESDLVVSIMSRMKWQRLSDIPRKVLLLRAGFALKVLANKAEKHMGELPGFLPRLLDIPVRRVKRVAAPIPGATVREISSAADLPDIMPQAGTPGAMRLADHHDFQWYEAAPDAFGSFHWLVFEADGEPIAFACARVYREGNCTAAKFIQMQSSRHDLDTYMWIIAETSQFLASRGANWIDARFSCPIMSDALNRVGYMNSGSDIVFWWPGSREPVDGGFSISILLGGEGLGPYPL